MKEKTQSSKRLIPSLNIMLVIFILFICSCSNKFAIKKGIKLDEVSLKIAFDTILNPEYVDIMKLNIDQFLNEYNNESNHMKVVITNNPDADIILNIAKVKSTSKFYLIASTVVSLGTLYFIIPNFPPYSGVLLAPVVFLAYNKSHTKAFYQLSPRISDFNKKQRYYFVTPRSELKKKEEIRRHLRGFDAHLGGFFDDFEKEYNRKKSK